MSPEDVNFLTLLTKFLSIQQGLCPLAGMTSTGPLFSMSSGNFSLRFPDNSSCPKVLLAQSQVPRCTRGPRAVFWSISSSPVFSPQRIPAASPSPPKPSSSAQEAARLSQSLCLVPQSPLSLCKSQMIAVHLICFPSFRDHGSAWPGV